MSTTSPQHPAVPPQGWVGFVVVGAGAPVQPPALLCHVPLLPLPDQLPVTIWPLPMEPVAEPETPSTESSQLSETLEPDAVPVRLPAASPEKAPETAPVELTTKFQLPLALPMYEPQNAATSPSWMFCPPNEPEPRGPDVDPVTEPPLSPTLPEMLEPSEPVAVNVAELWEPVHVPAIGMVPLAVYATA
jgi:hypothetical protein